MSELLLQRDYTIILAKTAASSLRSPPGFEQRWSDTHDSVLALLNQCEALDPDGITLYISSRDTQSSFRQYRNVTPAKLPQVIEANYPPDALNLLDALETALEDYFSRKAANQTKPNGEVILVLLDGEPPDRMAVATAIGQATDRLIQPEELQIGFVQIGDDVITTGFLAALDHDLRSTIGAQFDIVKTRILPTIAPDSLTEFLLTILRG